MLAVAGLVLFENNINNVFAQSNTNNTTTATILADQQQTQSNSRL